MTDFFEEGQQPVEEQKFKLGNDEYTESELQDLVGLGKLGREMEQKWKTPIDRVYPEFTKKSQQLTEYEKKIAELESKVNQPVQPTQSVQLTAEQRQQAIAQLDDLLRESKFLSEKTRQEAQAQLAAKDLINDVQYTLDQAKEAGQPETTIEAILDHMSQTGIKNPAKAYRDMYWDELNKLEVEKLQSLKPAGMVTTTSSTAGSKQPVQTPITKANLKQLVSQALGE